MKLISFFTGVRKEYILALVLTILIAFSLVGYLFEGYHVPLKVAFNTNGGGIIFNHRLHTEIDSMTCVECHHNYDESKKGSFSDVFNCRSCHYSSGNQDICKDEPIHKHCIGKNCINCHIKESVNCEFCHNARKFKTAEEPKEVIFETDGGKVVFMHKEHSSKDGYEIDCKTCHHNYQPDSKKEYSMNCRQCHYNSKYKSLCEKEETHIRCIGKQCMECHTDGEENCEICHKE